MLQHPPFCFICKAVTFGNGLALGERPDGRPVIKDGGRSGMKDTLAKITIYL